MKTLNLEKETENTLIGKCIKVYEGNEVSTKLIPKHLNKDDVYANTKSPVIIKTIKVKSVLILNKEAATVIAEVMTFIPSKNKSFSNENEVVKLDNYTCDIITDEEYKQVAINIQYAISKQAPEPIQTVISDYNGYNNISKTTDTVPTYVTTIIDNDDYGKPTIRHFKS